MLSIDDGEPHIHLSGKSPGAGKPFLKSIDSGRAAAIADSLKVVSAEPTIGIAAAAALYDKKVRRSMAVLSAVKTGEED